MQLLAQSWLLTMPSSCIRPENVVVATMIAGVVVSTIKARPSVVVCSPEVDGSAVTVLGSSVVVVVVVEVVPVDVDIDVVVVVVTGRRSYIERTHSTGWAVLMLVDVATSVVAVMVVSATFPMSSVVVSSCVVVSSVVDTMGSDVVCAVVTLQRAATMYVVHPAQPFESAVAPLV